MYVSNRIITIIIQKYIRFKHSFLIKELNIETKNIVKDGIGQQ